MSQNNSNDKAAMMAIIENINKVEGFDPAPFAVDFTDLNSQETRNRLPVMIQMAWFRLKYPEGKIAVQVTPAKDCFVATAKVYPKYNDPADCYLAEATASLVFVRISRLCLPVSGHRQRLLALLSEMPDSVFSLQWRAKILNRSHRTNSV